MTEHALGPFLLFAEFGQKSQGLKEETKNFYEQHYYEILRRIHISILYPRTDGDVNYYIQYFTYFALFRKFFINIFKLLSGLKPFPTNNENRPNAYSYTGYTALHWLDTNTEPIFIVCRVGFFVSRPAHWKSYLVRVVHKTVKLTWIAMNIN